MSRRRFLMQSKCEDVYASILYGYSLNQWNGLVKNDEYCVLDFTNCFGITNNLTWVAPDLPKGSAYQFLYYDANKNKTDSFWISEIVQAPTKRNATYFRATFKISTLDDSYVKNVNDYLFKGKNIK